MSNLPPAEVLAARLMHELKTAEIYAAEGVGALGPVRRALEILTQLREAMK